MLALVKDKRQLWLPILLMLVFAMTRWPGLLPPNFSAAYALSFCAGVFFPRRLAWWLPLATLVASDLIINCYYQFVQHVPAFKWTQLINYGAYSVLIWVGTRFSPRASMFRLIGGGVLGAVIFYLVTNTASWLFNPFHNPEYTRTVQGWIRALSMGTAGYPPTWEFFRNTLLSGGLFAGLFAGAMKLTEAAEAEAEEEPASAEQPEEPTQPQETEA
jgi:hypothetical protein